MVSIPCSSPYNLLKLSSFLFHSGKTSSHPVRYNNISNWRIHKPGFDLFRASPADVMAVVWLGRQYCITPAWLNWIHKKLILPGLGRFPGKPHGEHEAVFLIPRVKNQGTIIIRTWCPMSGTHSWSSGIQRAWTASFLWLCSPQHTIVHFIDSAWIHSTVDAVLGG